MQGAVRKLFPVCLPHKRDDRRGLPDCRLKQREEGQQGVQGVHIDQPQDVQLLQQQQVDEGVPQVDRAESALLLQSHLRTQEVPRLPGILRQRQSFLDLLQVFLTRVRIQQIQGA